MKMIDLLEKKKQGIPLSKQEIDFFVEGYTKGEIPDYQASALLMAIYLKKMNKEETANLTLAMAHSGDVLNLSQVEGIKVDKHSTGGVGDTTTLVVAPMVAALGIPVAKMSGRGLGHTGGTIDKLEAFSGFSIEMSEKEFIHNVNTIKVSVIGQTKDLAPADKKLYALRDVTSTVNDISLISSSIMSKKIAAGADCILLDVKVGDGAFMKTHEDAKALALEMVEIGKNIGRETIAIISDMDQPLGYAIGNALEVKEAMDTLKGNGPEDLFALCLEIGANMVLLAKKAKTKEEAIEKLKQTITTGAAFEKFKDFITAQGGSKEQVENPELLPGAKYKVAVGSPVAGYVTKIKAQNFGNIALELGAGRKTKEDAIDLGVGIVLAKKRGDQVVKGETLATVYANDLSKMDEAKKQIIQNYLITEGRPEELPLIYEVIG